MSLCPTEDEIFTSVDISPESTLCVINLLKQKNTEMCKLENDKLAIGLGLFNLFLFIFALFLFYVYMTKN